MTRPDSYIRQLEETIDRLSFERDDALKRALELEKQKRELEKENLKLKKMLALYINPHTPPSAKRFEGKKIDKKKSKKKKRGAPKGHKGATRTTPIPDEVIEVIADTCEKCGSSNIVDLDETIKSTIEDFPPPQEIKVTQYDRHKVRCRDCGHEFVSKHLDCPQIGNFGIYLLVYVTMLKFYLRGVLRKIQDFLLYGNNFEISVKGIHDILLRVGDVCKVGYDKTLKNIRSARWVHIDETGIKINGEKWWLWIFRSSENDILVVIRNSRGSDVVEEILGPDWDKPIIVDGWKAYWKFPIAQRCWSHLLREVDAFDDASDNGKRLSEDIRNRFKELKEKLGKDLSISKRIGKKTLFDNEMESLVDRYRGFEELKKPLTYIRNGLGKWYTCLLYPGMEPTNNLGEQAMREHVIIRKIIGCFRSENGAKNYQYIASLLASWKLQEKDIFEELEALLRKELCLS